MQELRGIAGRNREEREQEEGEAGYKRRGKGIEADCLAKEGRG